MQRWDECEDAPAGAWGRTWPGNAPEQLVRRGVGVGGIGSKAEFRLVAQAYPDEGACRASALVRRPFWRLEEPELLRGVRHQQVLRLLVVQQLHPDPPGKTVVGSAFGRGDGPDMVRILVWRCRFGSCRGCSASDWERAGMNGADGCLPGRRLSGIEGVVVHP